MTGAALVRSGRPGLTVQVEVAGAAHQLPSRHVTKNRGMRVRDCLSSRSVWALPIKLEAAVDAGDDLVDLKGVLPDQRCPPAFREAGRPWEGE
jgi:hypothetical protein